MGIEEQFPGVDVYDVPDYDRLLFNVCGESHGSLSVCLWLYLKDGALTITY